MMNPCKQQLLESIYSLLKKCNLITQGDKSFADANTLVEIQALSLDFIVLAAQTGSEEFEKQSQ